MSSQKFPEIIGGQPNPSDLSRRYSRFIAGAVCTDFRFADLVTASNLEVLHEHAFRDDQFPDKIFFKVLDAAHNTLFGVAADLNEDGTLQNYKCDVISI